MFLRGVAKKKTFVVVRKEFVDEAGKKILGGDRVFFLA